MSPITRVTLRKALPTSLNVFDKIREEPVGPRGGVKFSHAKQ